MFAVLDTNHFREYTHGTTLGATLRARIIAEQPDLFTCIVAAEESLSGWIALVRKSRAGLAQLDGYQRLHACIDTLGKLSLLPFDQEAATIFQALAQAYPRIGRMDLKIAAICITHDALLLSRNLGDFAQIPGLHVANWLD
ncbi:MAG: hypothetical protein JWO94_2601 [Verrucomicrobiaceae bacterium]|nr:hypothetical protein [Verrucomicrobiaceae bacterium]